MMEIFHRIDLKDCINSDLANNYGNLCQRTISFAIKNLKVKFLIRLILKMKI